MDQRGRDPNQRGFQSAVVDTNKVEIKPFKPRNLGEGNPVQYREVKERFGTLAQTESGTESRFELHPSSKRLLGVEAEERSHIEGMVTAEVENRLEQLRTEAFQKGFEQGRSEGKVAAESEHRAIMSPMEDRLSSLMAELDHLKKDLYSANESFLIGLIFQISKQVLLRELSTDREYIKRLTAHVVEKIGAKDHVRIKINPQDGGLLEQLKEHLKVQIPDLKNVQIEVSEEILSGGCKVETDLSRLNASVETQLSAIEKALGEA